MATPGLLQAAPIAWRPAEAAKLPGGAKTAKRRGSFGMLTSEKPIGVKWLTY